MKRPDYRTLQALDAVIRERGFEARGTKAVHYTISRLTAH
ncbi:chromosome initiation inhibitor [Escherichia coli]|uniref:Chromosome initiation inhibitor n=1 Tax=Escherichia coli TaxID=562 RepID=A0A376MJ84_ECOLX|nr:chromosome initiation inhibitor [Escherichia coli]